MEITQKIVALKLPEMERKLVASKKPTDSDQTWYNLYSDGYVEQGGIATETQASIVFLVVMADDNYTWDLSILSKNTTGATYNNLGIQTKTTTGLTIFASSTVRKSWQVSGYAAESEYSDKIVRREFIAY